MHFRQRTNLAFGGSLFFAKITLPVENNEQQHHKIQHFVKARMAKTVTVTSNSEKRYFFKKKSKKPL